MDMILCSHFPSDRSSLEGGPLGSCHQSPAQRQQQMEDTALAPTHSQTAAAAVYSRSSRGRRDIQNHSDRAVPSLDRAQKEENRGGGLNPE